MILAEDDGAICRLTLARPDKANALTREMLQDLTGAVQNTTASVLVLTGQGKVFSAGADLDAARAGLSTDPVWEALSRAIARFPGMSLAALNGTLAGGAFGMALACDMRIAVDGATFFYPVMKLGFLPQPSDPKRLSALIGPARAKRILLGGARIDAAEALDWGLVDQVVSRDDLDEAVAAITEDAARAAPDHVRAIKSLFA